MKKARHSSQENTHDPINYTSTQTQPKGAPDCRILARRVAGYRRHFCRFHVLCWKQSQSRAQSAIPRPKEGRGQLGERNGEKAMLNQLQGVPVIVVLAVILAWERIVGQRTQREVRG